MRVKDKGFYYEEGCLYVVEIVELKETLVEDANGGGVKMLCAVRCAPFDGKARRITCEPCQVMGWKEAAEFLKSIAEAGGKCPTKQ